MTDVNYSRQDIIDLHNELITYKELNKQYKFPYEERIAKEICLNELISNEFLPIEKETNKAKLKAIKKEKHDLEKKIREKCINLYHKNKAKEMLALKKNEFAMKRKQLEQCLENLKMENAKSHNDQKEKQIIRKNLLSIEDKINEKEKLENIDLDEIEKYASIYNERRMVYENYMEGLDENTCDILQQERHYMYSKGLSFIQSLVGFSIKSCELVNNKVKLHVESDFFRICITISEDRLENIQITDTNDADTDDAIRYCIEQNNPLYIFTFLFRKYCKN